MSTSLCEICGGSGFDRNNHVCIYCSGSGRDPYRSSTGIGGSRYPGRRGRSIPLPRSVQAILLILAFVGGAASYMSSDGSIEYAGLGAMLVLVTGLVVTYALRNFFPLLFLAVACYFIDQTLWDGSVMPKVINVVAEIVVQAYSEVF